jgi:hypothetical protein
MCASAPTLRVFFRRYLGSSFGGSQTSKSNSQGTVPKESITVIRDSASGSAVRDSAVPSLEKGEFLELQDLRTPASEDGADGLSRSSRTRERDLTRYSHEENMI